MIIMIDLINKGVCVIKVRHKHCKGDKRYYLADKHSDIASRLSSNTHTFVLWIYHGVVFLPQSQHFAMPPKREAAVNRRYCDVRQLIHLNIHKRGMTLFQSL